jgi:AMMECR1 domain-containing protein
LPEEIQRQAGTFVTIKKKRVIKRLYRYPSAEIRKPSIRSDPERYQSCERRRQVPALEIPELKELTFSVGVFTPPEIIKDIFNTI